MMLFAAKVYTQRKDERFLEITAVMMLRRIKGVPLRKKEREREREGERERERERERGRFRNCIVSTVFFIGWWKRPGRDDAKLVLVSCPISTQQPAHLLAF